MNLTTCQGISLRVLRQGYYPFPFQLWCENGIGDVIGEKSSVSRGCLTASAVLNGSRLEHSIESTSRFIDCKIFETLVRPTSSRRIGHRGVIQGAISVSRKNGVGGFDGLDQVSIGRKAVDVWAIFIAYPETAGPLSQIENSANSMGPHEPSLFMTMPSISRESLESLVATTGISGSRKAIILDPN